MNKLSTIRKIAVGGLLLMTVFGVPGSMIPAPITAISAPISVAHASCSVATAMGVNVNDTNPHVGDTITFTFTGAPAVTTDTQITALTDLVNSAFNFVSASPSVGSYNSATGIWDMGTISGATAVTLSVQVTLNASATGTITINPSINFVQSTCTQSSAINSLSITVQPAVIILPPVLPQADIAVSKTVDVTSTVETGTVHYLVTVTNLGPATGTGVAVADTLPSSLTFVSALASSGSYSSGTGVWTIGNMPVNATATLAITATVNAGTAGTTVTNTATATLSASSTDPTSSNNSASASFSVTSGGGGIIPPAADLAIVKTADVTSTIEGGTVNYTVMVTNLGPATATLLSATDTLPSGLTMVTAAVTHGAYSLSQGTWGIGTLAPNATATLTIQATANAGTAGQTITNTAVVGQAASTTDPVAGNNISSVSVLIRTSGGGGTPTSTADIAIVKTVSTSTPNPGDTITYTLTARALGPATSTNVVAHDVLPSGVSFISSNSSQGVYSLTTGDWTIGTIAPNATATLDLTVMVGTNQSGQTIANTATITQLSSLTDPNPSNNSSTVTVNVRTTGGGGGPGIPRADTTIVKTADVATTTVGGTVNFTLLVSALGPSTSTGVVATDAFPQNMTFVNATASRGSYASSTGVWTIGDMAPSSTATLTIQATANQGTASLTITNTAVITQSSSSVNLNPNTSSSVSVRVAPTSGGGGVGPTGGGGGGIGVTVGGGGAAYYISINNGATSTPTTSVMLGLYGTRAYTMEISNYADFSTSTGKIPYATSMPWQLLPGAGLKTVWAKYYDVNGVHLATVNASITLLGGQVLGATTCGLYLRDYIHIGWENDRNEVAKLQIFLNQNLGLNLPITGVYSQEDFEAVERFQVKYNGQVLAPWVPLGLPTATTPTGFVYQTTRRWINMLQCASLNLPMPELQVYYPGRPLPP